MGTGTDAAGWQRGKGALAALRAQVELLINNWASVVFHLCIEGLVEELGWLTGPRGKAALRLMGRSDGLHWGGEAPGGGVRRGRGVEE